MLHRKSTIHFKCGNISLKNSDSLHVFRLSCVVLLQACHKSVKIIFVLAGDEKKKKGCNILKTELLFAEKDIIFQAL